MGARLPILLTTATLAMPAAAPGAPVRHAITAPAAGAAVQALPYGGSWAAGFDVRGTAPKGRRVTITVPCGTGTCTTTATADRRGRWAAGVDAVFGVATSALRVTTRDGATVRTRTVRLRRDVPSPTGAGPTLVMTGDSLAVGTAGLLPQALPGWTVSTQARVGRRLATGRTIAAAGTLPPAGPLVLAFSLFTNDDPVQLPELDAAVRESVSRVQTRGCAIWATIARPPSGGRGYAGVNARLRALATDPALAGRLRVVDWSREYARHPSWRAKDRVHATPSGYRGRAALFAQAAQDCLAPAAPVPGPADGPGPGGAEAPPVAR